MKTKINTRTSEKAQIQSIIPIYDSNGETIMYAINFSKDQGYYVVSATKKFHPIIAIIDSGRFNGIENDNPASVLFQDYENSIHYYKEFPLDSLTLFKKNGQNMRLARDYQEILLQHG